MSYQSRLKRFLVLSVLGLILGASIAGLSLLIEKKGAVDYVPIAAPNIGGAFTLVNQDGKTVTDKDFQNKYLFIYFGFASCPAICPTELQKMTEAYEALPKVWQDRIQPVFITIDPERDTPAILKNYVELFMPNMIGLTGTVEQVEAVKKAYKVYGAKVPQGDTYTMDHSSFIYFMSYGGERALALFKATDDADRIAKTIPTLDGLD